MLLAIMVLFHKGDLKFSRGKYIVVLPNSAQKQIFTDKTFMIKLLATPCFFFTGRAPTCELKSVKFFNLKNFRLYGMYALGGFKQNFSAMLYENLIL